MPARTSWSWVEAYGRLIVDPARVHGPWAAAVEATAGALKTVVKAERLDDVHRLLDRFAETPPAATLHLGSGWGALERARRRQAHVVDDSPGLPFPDESLGVAEQDWLTLLTEGRLPDSAPTQAPMSYIVDPSWQPLIQHVPETWASALRLGVLRLASGDETAARKAWERSFELARTPGPPGISPVSSEWRGSLRWHAID